MKIEAQKDFPLYEKFSEKFPVTKNTIFAYDDVIYTDYNLPDHLIIHEQTHHTQQKRDGLEYWVENYLNNPEYRLKQEIEAYKNQINSIKDRNLRAKILMECSRNLASDLYSSIITYQEAYTQLKVWT